MPGRSRDQGHHRAGQPIAIARPLQRDPEGRVTLTAGERFIQLVGSGAPEHVAAAGASLTMQAVSDNLRAGARIQALITAGRRTLATLTPDEQRQLAFAEDYARANADAIARLTALAMHHIVGGGTITTTKVVESEGKVTTTTTTQQVGPDAQMLRWWMERRWPLVFGQAADPAADTGSFTLDPEPEDRLTLLLERAREATAVEPAGPLDVIDTTSV